MKLRSILLFSLSLFTTANLFAQVSAPSLETAFQNYLSTTGSGVNTGGVLPTFLIKENTRGNRYLFDHWVNGTVLGTDGVTYKPKNAQFNYDKIEQKLFMLVDNKTVMELGSGSIAGFSLTSNDSNFHFERLKNSTNLHFYQPIYKSEKGYSLYKMTDTEFKKADYQSNGMLESGNKYDEYVDQDSYYILTSKGELIKIDFKKKSIVRALENESSKVETFFTEHKKDRLDEELVKNLLQYINS